MTQSVESKGSIFSLVHANRNRLKALGVKRLGLFGSFVREEQSADSDVDVLVDFDPAQKSFDNFVSLANLLEELFQREVEVVTTESLSPHIGPHILDEVEYVALDA